MEYRLSKFKNDIANQFGHNVFYNIIRFPWFVYFILFYFIYFVWLRAEIKDIYNNVLIRVFYYLLEKRINTRIFWWQRIVESWHKLSYNTVEAWLPLPIYTTCVVCILWDPHYNTILFWHQWVPISVLYRGSSVYCTLYNNVFIAINLPRSLGVELLINYYDIIYYTPVPDWSSDSLTHWFTDWLTLSTKSNLNFYENCFKNYFKLFLLDHR